MAVCPCAASWRGTSALGRSWIDSFLDVSQSCSSDIAIDPDKMHVVSLTLKFLRHLPISYVVPHGSLQRGQHIPTPDIRTNRSFNKCSADRGLTSLRLGNSIKPTLALPLPSVTALLSPSHPPHPFSPNSSPSSSHPRHTFACSKSTFRPSLKDVKSTSRDPQEWSPQDCQLTASASYRDNGRGGHQLLSSRAWVWRCFRAR